MCVNLTDFMDYKKRVLFITYYWPPSGKASLHWPLRVTRYLPEFGWEPLVLTVENESFTEKDESLLNEISPGLRVVKTKAFEVFDFYKKFIGKKKNDSLSVSETMSVENRNLRYRFSVWIRMNLFVPDARMGWYSNGVKGGKRLISSLIKETHSGKPIDAIISIGTPHSTHLIGKKLNKIFGIPHLPLFTDPWVSSSYYRQFKRNILAERLDSYFEKSILLNAAKVIFVTKNTREEYVQKYPSIKDKSEVLYWGYNEDAFLKLKDSPKSEKDSEVLIHTGNIFDYQNPVNFWKTLRKRLDSGTKLKIRFTGTVGPGILKSIDKNGLSEHCEYLGFVPYTKLLEELSRADCLMVCSYDRRHVPGKLFEYLRTGKPIIAFCDDNKEIEKILEETNAGMLFSYDSSGEEFFDSLSKIKTDISKVKRFDRYNIARELSEILDDL